MAVFERACLLATSGDNIITLVLPQIGDGPLNIVVETRDQPGVFECVEQGMVANLNGTRLRIGRFELTLDQTEIWEPQPDWDRLRAHHAAIERHLPLLQALALEQTPDDSLLPLTAQSSRESRAGWQPALPTRDPRFTQALWTTVSEATTSLAAGWRGDHTRLAVGAAHLAGLGGGLTPAGDDFLAGVMLRAWLAHPAPRPFCQTLLNAAGPRTTTVSAAFLRAAADGQCSATWHHLLDALSEPTKTLRVSETLRVSLRAVLAHGHTSGADSLAGFLWLLPRG